MLNKFSKPLALAVLMASAVLIHGQTVTGSVALPGLPEQVAVNPLTNRVYVAVPNFGALPYDYLTVIDGRTDTVITSVQIPPLAYAVAVDPVRNIVYVGGNFVDVNGVSQNEIVAVSGRTNNVITTISVSTTPGNGIQGLACNWRTGTLYASNASDNEVDVIRHLAVVSRIAVSDIPYGVAVNSFLNLVYVALLNGNVSIIDGATRTITSTTPFGASDVGIAVNPVTGNVFTTNQTATPPGSVGVLGSTGAVLSAVPVGNTPYGIDVDFRTNVVFVANSQDDTVSVIDGKTNTVTTTLPVSSLFLAANPRSGKVYVAPAANTPTLAVISQDPPHHHHDD